jgi:signal transduction histidine kinase
MVYMTIIFIVIVFMFLTRLYSIKKELKRTTHQLKQMNKKIDLTFYDKDLEKLAIEINRQVDLTKQANAEKRRIENELKQAVANISHDIRTPMTSIIGYVQLLESNTLSKEEHNEYLHVVKTSSLRLKVLLEDFFELSIIESADYPLKIENIKMNNLVIDVLVGFFEGFNQRGIEPDIHIPEEEILIKTDPSAVKRVIENLVNNAVRHSSGNVTISLEEYPTSVELIINNPAEQLHEKDLYHLFDRFYKADQTRMGKGTGLGLAIAKSLMMKMNGNLTAELKDGQLFMKCQWKL